MTLETNVSEDDYLLRYFDEKDLSPQTEKNYTKQLKKFCEIIDEDLSTIIENCKAQQNIETEEIISQTNEDGRQIVQKRVTKFNVNGSDSLVKKYFNQYTNTCKERGNKNTTINSGRDVIKTVLSYFDVKLPKIDSLEDDTADWNLLTKEDIKFVLADSTLMHKSLILFMISSGLRIQDCLDITIGEYMDATSDYHEFVEVDDFIDHAPDEMMGYWDFMPNKTKKKHIICKTFNSPESNRFILQNLRKIKNEYFKNSSKNLTFTKEDSLFGSKKKYYKEAPNASSISSMYWEKDKLLNDWHMNIINQEIKDGKISSEDKKKQISLIPEFHPHACRKYFSTMIERHTSNERRYRLMEGHAPRNKIDKSYINISKEEIAEVYNDAITDLSVYVDNDEDINNLREELENQKQKYQKEIETLKAKHHKEMENLKVEVQKTNKAVEVLEDRITKSRTNLPFHKVNNVIFRYLRGIKENEVDFNRASLLQMMVYNHIRENPAEFEDNEEYLLKLVRKFDIQIELSSKDIAEQKADLAEQINPEDVSPWFIFLIQHLLKILDDDERISKRVGHIDMNKWDYVAENYLIEVGISPNLSEADLAEIKDTKELAGEILIKYIETE